MFFTSFSCGSVFVNHHRWLVTNLLIFSRIWHMKSCPYKFWIAKSTSWEPSPSLLWKFYGEITALRKPHGSLSSRCGIDIPTCSSELRYNPLIHTDYVLIHNENACLHVHKADKCPNFKDEIFIRSEECNVHDIL
jgi:hypothetical protein